MILLAAADIAAPSLTDWRVALTLAIVVACTLVLVFSRLAADAVLCSGLAVLIVSGVVSPRDALGGFANQALFTVAALYVVAEGVRQTGGMARLARPLLGTPRTPGAASVRLLLPAAVLSAFMNNTPVVAMLIPAVGDWARRLRLSASHLLLPLSYATILGGLCTVLGTSTTILLNGELASPKYAETFGTRGLTFFEIAKVGLPVSVFGLGFLLLFSRRLLPDRKAVIDRSGDPREYTVEMKVAVDGPIDGRTIRQAGLRSLPGVYLAEVERDGNLIPAASPHTPLAGGDRLVFVGAVGSVVDLQRIPGLHVAADEVDKITAPRILRGLVEAVVSGQSPLVGRTIRASKFRTKYNAVVIAVGRDGEKLPGKIGDIVVKPGDTLLVEAHSDFFNLHRDDRDFLLVSRIDDSAPVRHEKAFVGLAVLAFMVLAAIGLDYFRRYPQVAALHVDAQSMFLASLVAALLMILFRCVRVSEARASIDLSVLATMGAGIGLGHAMELTGAATLVATNCITLAAGDAFASLVIVMGLTMLASNFITAKAAGLILLPIALETAVQTGASAMPFAIAVIIGAASSFITPFGYQTNLMVYGPGGYKSSDFRRIGLLLSGIVWVVGVLAISWGWPLRP